MQLPVHLQPCFPEARAELSREAEAQDLCWGEQWLRWDIGCRWSRDGGQVWVLNPSAGTHPRVGRKRGLARAGLTVDLTSEKLRVLDRGREGGAGLESLPCNEVCQVSAASPPWGSSA